MIVITPIDYPIKSLKGCIYPIEIEIIKKIDLQIEIEIKQGN